MPKFESVPNINNPELTPKEQVDVNAGKKLKGELTPEELEKLEVQEGPEEEAEKPELSLEEQLKNLEGEMESRKQEMMRLTESIERTKAKLNEAR
jgi:predicted  nucleic acid-binding Zn-ribbon protein